MTFLDILEPILGRLTAQYNHMTSPRIGGRNQLSEIQRMWTLLDIETKDKLHHKFVGPYILYHFREFMMNNNKWNEYLKYYCSEEARWWRGSAIVSATELKTAFCYHDELMIMKLIMKEHHPNMRGLIANGFSWLMSEHPTEWCGLSSAWQTLYTYIITKKEMNFGLLDIILKEFNPTLSK